MDQRLARLDEGDVRQIEIWCREINKARLNPAENEILKARGVLGKVTIGRFVGMLIQEHRLHLEGKVVKAARSGIIDETLVFAASFAADVLGLYVGERVGCRVNPEGFIFENLDPDHKTEVKLAVGLPKPSVPLHTMN